MKEEKIGDYGRNNWKTQIPGGLKNDLRNIFLIYK
jgi:hypothetical protein